MIRKLLLALATLAPTLPASADEFHVYPNRLENAAGQSISKDWRFKPNQSFSQALDLARQTPGADVVWIHGDVSDNGGVTLGLHANPLGGKLGGLVGCEIVGATVDASIPALTIFQQYEVSALQLRDLQVIAGVGNHCVLAAANQAREHVDFSFVRCRFNGLSTDTGSAAWAIRIAGPSLGLIVLECIAVDFREHFVYLDNPAEAWIALCKILRCRRTGVQSMNRSWTGRKSYGQLLIERCEFTDCGADGASSVTLGGYTGQAIVRACTINTDEDTGGILAYGEGPKPKHGLPGCWKDENGNAITSLKIIGRSKITMGNPRFVISVNDTGRLEMGPMTFADSGKPAIWLNTPGIGGPVDSVSLGFDSSTAVAWPPNSERMRVGQKTLTAQEIDALATALPPVGVTP